MVAGHIACGGQERRQMLEDERETGGERNERRGGKALYEKALGVGYQ